MLQMARVWLDIVPRLSSAEQHEQRSRRMMKHKRARLARLAARASSAAKIQSAWRGKVARDAYLRIRSSWLASREIQRVYRGHLRRRTAMRRRDWQAAAPGAERLKLGMRIIEDTKVHWFIGATLLFH